ncbi:MAG: hypothetical protein LBG21_03300 [Campylobacteraceae bacterium]|jgi:hypothetical protein|nr:hypothetical protein [Campylobacteraceae bacterium]
MIIPKSQKIWDYIRRNPIFRAGDIVTVTDIRVYIVTEYLRSWEKAGYIVLVEKTKNIRDRIYKLAKKSVQAPARGKNGMHDRKPKEKKVIKDLQTKSEKAVIAFTHAQIKPAKKEKANIKTEKITFEARLIKGQKGIGYSPTIYKIDDVGNIVCRDTGFVVDKVEIKTGESYGYACPRKGAA